MTIDDLNFQTKPVKQTVPTHKSYLTKKRIKTIQKRKAIAILLPLAIACVVILITWYQVIAQISSQSNNVIINIAKVDKIQNKIDAGKNLSIEEHIWYILDKEYHLSFKEKIEAVAIIQCESKFDPYAINKNLSGSYDLGIWQINEKHHPDITRACAFDVFCATQYALDKIYLKQGNWSAWTCSR